MPRRKMHVAGSFYPRFKPDLIRSLKETFLNKEFGPGEEISVLNTERTIIGGISPHSSLNYSGNAAAHTYLNIFKEGIPDTIVIIGSYEEGYDTVSVLDAGEWETPLGNLKINEKLSNEIIKSSEDIIANESAFIGFPFGREHNIEVQLPFIKYCSGEKEISIVTIILPKKDDINFYRKISENIAKAINSSNEDIVIIGTFSLRNLKINDKDKPDKELKTYKKQDQSIIDAFSKNDADLTFKKGIELKISEPQTLTTLMLICKELGATNSQTLKYYTSYERSGGKGPCHYLTSFFSGIIAK